MEHTILPSISPIAHIWPTLVRAQPSNRQPVLKPVSNKKASIPMSSSIRVATEEDVPTLLAGLRALAQDLTELFDVTEAQISAALFGPKAVGFGLLAGHQGVALVQPQISTSFGGVLGYVSDLWVAKEVRGVGLGSALLAATARESATRWNAVGLRLAVQGDARRLRSLYARLGLVLHPRDRKAVLTGIPFQALQEVA